MKNLSNLAVSLCALAGVMAPVLAGQATEAQVLTAINAARAQARTCPGNKSFPAAPPLTAKASITAAALKMSETGAYDQRPVLADSGYLAFDSGNLFYAQGIANDPKAMVDYWLAQPAGCANCISTCEVVMQPFTEAGFGSVMNGTSLRISNLVVAVPFEQARIADYTARMFKELNRIRATGINTAIYPDAKCTSAPVPALKWNDKLAQAAQFHSDDYAAKGVYTGADGSPHTGTAGDNPSSRVAAAGCKAGAAENVSFNYGKTPEEAVRGWIGLSAGHCGNLVNTTVNAAGFGIAHSAALLRARIGPFVTMPLARDTGCEAFTKTEPGAAGSTTTTTTPPATTTPAAPAPTNVTFSFFNQGGYVARYSVTFTSGGKTQTCSTGDTTAGFTKTCTVPADATGVKAFGQEATGLAWEPWRTVFNQSVANPLSNKCYKTWGTTLNPQWGGCS